MTSNFANTNVEFRSSPRVPGHRASLAHRGQPDPQALPHAHLRPERCRCQVKVLVLPRQAPKDQEGERRDHFVERGASKHSAWLIAVRCIIHENDSNEWSDSREAPSVREELWYLDPIRLSLRHPQHVQGVPRDVSNRCCARPLPGYGCPSPSSF